MNEPKILFLDEPTQGIDVGAKNEIYEIIDQLAATGVSIVMVSGAESELNGSRAGLAAVGAAICPRRRARRSAARKGTVFLLPAACTRRPLRSGARF